MSTPVKVLIVDDSLLVRMLLKKGLSQFDNIEVIGTASDPYEARDFIEKHHPDVITLDVEMPKMNGIEFLKHLMAQMPTPVIMVSGLTESGKQITLDALSYGAIDFVTKPLANEPASFSNMIHLLHGKISMAAGAAIQKTRVSSQPPKAEKQSSIQQFRTGSIIAIGASTGGTEAIKEIIPFLPENTPPIVLTQHMPKGFTSIFAHRLDAISKVSVREATDGQEVTSGQVLIAPGGKQMKLIKRNGKMIVTVGDDALVNGHRPSVSYLFSSLIPFAKDVTAVLLTGMGKDGSEDLLHLKQNGATTIAQDKESSVVFGMPGEAIRLGGATKVLPLSEIAQAVIQQVKE